MHIGNYITTNTHDLQISKRYAEEPDAPASLLFLQIVNELMIEHALQFPGTVQDAMCLVYMLNWWY